MTPPRPVYNFTKRGLDLVGALLLLVLLAPLLVTVWILVLVKLGPPAFFQQERAGLHARPFRIHKFRSMLGPLDAEGRSIPKGERITRFGLLLRRLSLDELPQLWNVLMGDMSFVGPRPLYLSYVSLYTPEQRRRLDVKPGITGLAQIGGRTTLSWEERFALDVDYVDRASLGLDLSILVRTVKKVLMADGVSREPNPRFQGSGDSSSRRSPADISPKPPSRS
jgi:lipopolysaccharide/colanic/teichoic acid biosynthesis glycosyltransferase